MNTDKLYAESIANQYSVKNDSKVVALRKLDRKVKRPPLILAYVLGGASALVLGTGMCFAMGVIGPGGSASLVGGSLLGLAGIAGMAVSSPLHQRMLAARKRRYAGDIMRLANGIARED